MIQIYFMSVLLNILGGIILAFPMLIDKFKFLTIFEDIIKTITENQKTRNIFGIVFLVGSVLAIIGPYKVPIIGDLIPAISLFLIGFILFLSQNVPNGVQNVKEYGKFKLFIEKNQQIIGVSAISIGIIHFFVAELPFL